MKISAVINTKNAAKSLEQTLKSLDFVDEIIVVDMHSTDETVEIARQYSDHVFSHPDVGFVEPARNFALKKASGDWILVIDSDEVVGLPLAKKLRSIASESSISGSSDGSDVADCFYLARKNIIFGHWVQTAGWWPDYILRFFRKGHVEWSEKIHSVPITRGTVAELPANEQLALLHYNYASVNDFVERLNRYTSIQAQEKTSDPAAKNVSPATFITAFKEELLSRLFPRRGITGGMHGVSLSFLQALSEVVTTAKVWQADGFAPSKKDSQETLVALDQLRRELAYWIADERCRQTSGFTKWWWRLQRARAV